MIRQREGANPPKDIFMHQKNQSSFIIRDGHYLKQTGGNPLLNDSIEQS